MTNSNVLYKEVQHFRNIVVWIIVGCIAIFMLYSGIEQLIFGNVVGSRPAPDGVMAVFVAVFGIIFPIAMISVNLKTEVKEDGLYISYFPFIPRKRKIPPEMIASAEPKHYNALRDYGGWGLRYGIGGKAYNISGNEGVMIRLVDGEHFLLGTKNSERLAETINNAVNNSV